MFFGEYEHQKDDKNRIRIPPKFKSADVFKGEYVFAKGFDGVINVYPKEVAEERTKKYRDAISEFDEEGQAALMEYMSSMYNAAEDKQGRVALPDTLVTDAGLEKDLVTVGMIDHLAIMNKSTREKKREQKSFAASMKILSDRIK